LKDIRDHWAEWRAGWEQKLAHTEIQFLRSVSELQAAFQHRVTLMDANYREQMKAQHADFERAMRQHAGFERTVARQSEEMQQRFWDEVVRARAEYERIIHSELRLVRQRASLGRAVEQVAQSAPPEFANVDWLKFARSFAGPKTTFALASGCMRRVSRARAGARYRLRTRRNAASPSARRASRREASIPTTIPSRCARPTHWTPRRPICSLT
jgi:hypothetical protein